VNDDWKEKTMLYQIIAIAVKEFKVLFHDRRAFFQLFILPIVFILVMTVLLQGMFDTGTRDHPVDLLVVNQDQGSITSAEQNVPGYTIYGVFVIMMTISTSLFREKNEGTFRRLQAAPIYRAVILAGKLLPYYLINLIQIALMLTIGVLVFHIGLGSHPLCLIPLSLALAAAATGLGLLLASLGKSQEEVTSLGMLLSILLAALGGIAVPTYVMPSFMQKLSLAIPHSWALTGFQDVIVRNQGMEAVLPIVGILLGYALVFWGIAIWRFRFE
jgi:ABC-2 type transport system permease protein